MVPTGRTGGTMTPDKALRSILEGLNAEAEAAHPTSGPVLEGLITEAETARELNRCARTLKRWRSARTGPPFIRIGTEVYYRREAVRAWVLAQERPQVRAGRSRAA